MAILLVIRKIFALLILSGLIIADVSAIEKLYVFFPSKFNSKLIQEIMSENIKDVNITVFGKYNDFINQTKTDPPDAVLTKTILIKDQLNNYEISLNGERNSKTDESFVILSTEKNISSDSVNSQTVIGVIDILGRAGMNTFAKNFFQAEPKLKRVSKLEDLLSLISFNMVDAILIEGAFLDYFKSTSQLKFNTTPLDSFQSGIVALAVKKGANTEKIIAGIKRNDKKVCDLFLIEKWK